jgi:hypothetical protein
LLVVWKLSIGRCLREFSFCDIQLRETNKDIVGIELSFIILKYTSTNASCWFLNWHNTTIGSILNKLSVLDQECSIISAFELGYHSIIVSHVIWESVLNYFEIWSCLRMNYSSILEDSVFLKYIILTLHIWIWF